MIYFLLIMINWWSKVTLFRMSITCSSFFRFLSVPVYSNYSHFHHHHNDHNDQMRIVLTTWQLSRCPLLRRGGQVRVLQKVLNRFNGHRLQWYFGQRLSHIFSLLNEIGYFAIKFRHKASHLIFVALGNKFCRFPDVIPSLSDVLFI